MNKASIFADIAAATGPDPVINGDVMPKAKGWKR